jgi:[protein-PII] uridylyltransferase
MLLWDIGLEVGSSVRNLAQCREEAGRDVTVITNLMESRLLCGSRGLFQAMQEAISPARMWPSEPFFEAKFAEQEQRHRRYHDTAYNLEPNIKDGPGGLRDIQMIGWVAKRHFGANDLRALVYHGFLSEEEYETLSEAQRFLWRIRCLLHGMSKRKEDRLAFDFQRQIAQQLGYQDGKRRLAVEKFMRHYYRQANEISRLNELLLQVFREAIFHRGENRIVPLNRRFQVCNDYLEVRDEHVFERSPLALLETFLLLAQYPELRGIRASTGRLLRRDRHLLDEALRRDIRARSLFLEILREPRGQTRAFRQMNRYGILGAYIPAFDKIVGQMQYDLFHVYTVDQHSLFVLRNLRRLIIPKHDHELPQCSAIMRTIGKPELLYLAALFHDIAKGRGGDHSLLGEVDAMDFCLTHGLSDRDSRLVAWLVRWHLQMSTTAQRQDLTDPQVINQFARQMMDCEHLDYLYLLTVADIRGTNPALWNAWKGALLAELYRKTRQVLQKGVEELKSRPERVADIQRDTLRLLPGREEAARALWRNIDDNYFLRSPPADIARETQAILGNGVESPLVMIRRDNPESSEFLIYARDKEFLFAETTHFLEQQGVTVMDAYLATTQQGHTLLNYTVLEETGEPISPPERAEFIRQGLLEAAQRHQPFACPINRRMPRQVRHFKVPTKITFSRDLNSDYTVMEVVTTDRPGVLSRIAQAMLACGVKVRNARIATLGSRVEDIFFIVGQDNQALHRPDQFDCLQEQLAALLDSGDEGISPVMVI